MMSASTWLLIALGTGAGFASGLLGIGGGIIYVPALMYIAGIPIHIAIGVSLACIVPTAAAAVIKHYIAGNVDIPLVLIVAPASIIGAVLGAYVSSITSADLLKKIFGLCLIVIGVNTLFGFTDNLKTSMTSPNKTSSHDVIE